MFLLSAGRFCGKKNEKVNLKHISIAVRCVELVETSMSNWHKWAHEEMQVVLFYSKDKKMTIPKIHP